MNKSINEILNSVFTSEVLKTNSDDNTTKKYKIVSPNGCEIAFSNSKAELKKYAKKEGWLK